MMSFICKTLGLRLGCTWVVKTEDPAVRWNTTEGQGQLEMTGATDAVGEAASGEEASLAKGKQWLECTVCGKRKDEPTPDEVKSLVG